MRFERDLAEALEDALISDSPSATFAAWLTEQARERLVTLKQAAEALGIPVATIKSQAKSGAFDTVMRDRDRVLYACFGDIKDHNALTRQERIRKTKERNRKENKYE